MPLRSSSIRWKLMRMTLVTSGVVLVTTGAALFLFDTLAQRRGLMANLTTIGRMTAANSTAALAFANPEDADQVLAVLREEPHLVAAGIYDVDGRLFASYRRDTAAIPSAPGADGQRFESGHALVVVPIAEASSRRLGTLYVASDMLAIRRRAALFAAVAGGVAVMSLLLAYLVSRALQREVSAPLLELAGTARAIADRRDYSVRAHQGGEGEIGLLTLAFNRMLTQIEEQDGALRRSEARFRRLSDSDVIGVVTADESGLITEANDAFLDLVGRGREELVAGRLHWEGLAPRSWPALRTDVLAQLRADGRSTPWELEAARPDGTRVPIILGAAVLGESDGRLDYVGYVLDLSAQKSAEQSIRAYARELERSNSDLEQFAYVASHDLQEPLRMVASYTELLERRYADRLDATAQEFIRFAASGAQRMQNLIVALLDFSRVKTRGAALAPVDMDAVLEQVREQLRAAAAEAAARITSSPLPTVIADQDQMVRLLQNLISNGIRFRGPQPPLVHVEAEQRGDDWLFSVRDNGIGIDAQHFDRIFVIFQRLHRREEIEGTGIGLAICKRIIARHHGEIWVDSVPGEGSVFRFTIPLRPPAA